MKQAGVLITFEGLDGCGKSTQLELEAERLRCQGRAVTSTKEPGGTAVGMAVREIVLNSQSPLSASTELALMFAARSQHIEEVIQPRLQAGDIVLCDRFTDSTVAYQGYGRGFPLDGIQTLDHLLCHSVHPDLTLFLDIDPETAAQRTVSRNRVAHQKETRFEEEGLAFFERVRRGYQEIARREPERVRTVDASGSMAEVRQRVGRTIEEFLKSVSS